MKDKKRKQKHQKTEKDKTQKCCVIPRKPKARRITEARSPEREAPKIAPQIVSQHKPASMGTNTKNRLASLGKRLKVLRTLY